MTLPAIIQRRLRREAAKPPPATIHIAVCVNDERTARWLKQRTAVIAPATWPGRVRLHVLIGNDTGISDTMRVALADLQLVNHEDLDLVYPQELELGWPNE